MDVNPEKNFWNNLSEQVKTLMGAALAFVAGLAWNDAISSAIKMIFPQDNASSLILKFAYAIVITAIIVILLYYMNRVEYRMRQRIRARNQKQNLKK
jgi:predicted PurR-regulated permease PerM